MVPITLHSFYFLKTTSFLHYKIAQPLDFAPRCPWELNLLKDTFLTVASLYLIVTIKFHLGSMPYFCRHCLFSFCLHVLAFPLWLHSRLPLLWSIASLLKNLSSDHMISWNFIRNTFLDKSQKEEVKLLSIVSCSERKPGIKTKVQEFSSPWFVIKCHDPVVNIYICR